MIDETLTWRPIVAWWWRPVGHSLKAWTGREAPGRWTITAIILRVVILKRRWLLLLMLRVLREVWWWERRLITTLRTLW